MGQFSVNAFRIDLYKNFKFRVKRDGRYVSVAAGYDLNLNDC